VGVRTDPVVAPKEIAKLLDGEAGVANDTAEGEGVDRVVTRNGENAHAV
jgi:hypothetical protein